MSNNTTTRLGSQSAPTVNQEAINLIKEFEGFRAEAYFDSANVLTIGYGTTARAGVGIAPKAGMVITEEQAEVYLRKAVDKFAAQIRPHITAPINENEFGAFVSLAYNIGPGAFKGSTALRLFNAGGKVLNGLVRRRQAEMALFLKPAPKITAPLAAPSEGLFAALAAAIVAVLALIMGAFK